MKLFLKRVLFLKLLLFTIYCKAQVNVVINLIPPYSPYISDYVNNPNKTLITLIPNGVGPSTLDIYFKASIEGDNGISIKTKPNYKPSNPLTISNLTPTVLNIKSISDYFNTSQMTFQGITLNELVYGNGLPEGNYTFCIQVFDYNTDLQLSNMPPSGCSPNFTIQHLDPPLATSPSCGSNIFTSPVQNVLFNWTYNPGYNFNIQYLLKIVPVLPTQNPNDAINSMVTPAFFEKIIKSTSYLYGPADPLLEKGKTYAYRIKAFDPNNKMMFKNNGESEVCTFVYGEKDTSKKVVINTIPKTTTSKLSKIEVLNPYCGKSPISNNQLYIKWKTVGLISNDKLQKTSEKYLIEIREYAVSKIGVVIPYEQLKINYTEYSTKDFVQTNASLLKLSDNKKYYFKIYKEENGIKVAESTPCMFTYTFTAPAIKPSSNDYTVKGQIVYTCAGKNGEFVLNNTSISIKEIYYLAESNQLDEPIYLFNKNPITNEPINEFYSKTDENGYINASINLKNIGIMNEKYTHNNGNGFSKTGTLVKGITIKINNKYYL